MVNLRRELLMNQEPISFRPFWIAGWVLFCWVASPALAGETARYVRFEKADLVAYGLVEGERVRQLRGDLFGQWTATDQSYSLDEIRLLVPCQPSKVIAMAGNYRSHLGGESSTTTITTITTIRTDSKTGATTSDTQTSTETVSGSEVPAKFQIPQPFFKSPSCLIPQGSKIVLPKQAGPVHYEGEMVIVIGKEARQVSKDKALEHVFGVTCGNDVSARSWQKNDVQWWRAKASDTFGPCGPYIVSGLDYENLRLRLRLNGEVRQEARTCDLIHGVASLVSFLSQHLTLHPGDLIFTGTPGQTSALAPGDVVEVELDGVGILRNRVVAAD